MSNPRRHLLLLAAGAVGALVAGCGRKAESFKSTDITGADYGRTLNLPDTSGKLRSLDDFKGRLVLVFFGFTQCPDICPTTLAKAVEIRRLLGAAANDLQVLFVTVDPERDSAEVLAPYVSAFDPSFIGLRGDMKQTAAAAREFKVFYQKVPNRDGSNYTVDHTAASYVLDKQGRLRLFVKHAQSADEIAADLKKLL
jgi:protein SCO1